MFNLTTVSQSVKSLSNSPYLKEVGKGAAVMLGIIATDFTISKGAAKLRNWNKKRKRMKCWYWRLAYSVQDISPIKTQSGAVALMAILVLAGAGYKFGPTVVERAYQPNITPAVMTAGK